VFDESLLFVPASSAAWRLLCYRSRAVTARRV
jgi:hypothetical protein